MLKDYELNKFFLLSGNGFIHFSYSSISTVIFIGKFKIKQQLTHLFTNNLSNFVAHVRNKDVFKGRLEVETVRKILKKGLEPKPTFVFKH